MNNQANVASILQAAQQSLAAAEYICTIVDGVVVYEENDDLILDFGQEAY